MYFFFNDTATTEIYTLSLHDALPIWTLVEGERDDRPARPRPAPRAAGARARRSGGAGGPLDGRHDRDGVRRAPRSEEHTSELQSQFHLVCRLLLEKKKQ